MPTATIGTESPVRISMTVPPPPAPPEPAKFTHYRVDTGRYGREEKKLSQAVERWLELGVEAEFTAHAEHWDPRDGSTLYRVRFSYEKCSWGEWVAD